MSLILLLPVMNIEFLLGVGLSDLDPNYLHHIQSEMFYQAPPHSEIGATDDRRMYLEESTDVTPVEEAVTDCRDHPNCENVDVRQENACSNVSGISQNAEMSFKSIDIERKFVSA